VGEATGRHALTEEVMRTVPPRPHMSCPLDGEPLREMQLAEMQPALFTHVDGTSHPDLLTELTVREEHLEQSALQAMDALITEGRGSTWQPPISALEPLRGDSAEVELHVQRGGIQYRSLVEAFESRERVEQDGGATILDEPTEAIPRVPLLYGSGKATYQIVEQSDLVPEDLAGQVVEPLRAVDLPGLGCCEVVAEATEDRPALVRQVQGRVVSAVERHVRGVGDVIYEPEVYGEFVLITDHDEQSVRIPPACLLQLIDALNEMANELHPGRTR